MAMWGRGIDLKPLMNRFAPFLLLALVLACGRPQPATHGTSGIYGGVFNYNESQVVNDLFPLTLTLVSEQNVSAQIYEGLVRFNSKDLNIEPALAERWELDSTGTVYTFHLRPGVRFHDHPVFPGGKGRELTAQDVVHCLAKVCERGMGDAAFWLLQQKVEGADAYHDSGGTDGKIAGLKALNDRTVRIKLVQPTPNFLQALAVSGCWIWPKELWEEHAGELLTNAVGTGPFRLKAIRPEEAIILERNPNYWGTDGQGRPLPYLDAVRITLLPNKEREASEFLKGHLSMVAELALPSFGVLADSVDQHSGKRRFQVFSTPALAVQFYGFKTWAPPLDNPLVRRAFSMAIDRQLLVDSVLHGFALPATTGLVPPGMAGYPGTVDEGTSHDPDKARELMKRAGYPGGEGFPRIQLQVNTNGFGYRVVGSAVQEMLGKELGVALTLTSTAPGIHYERIEQGKADFWREGWVADLPDPGNFLTLLYGKHAEADTSLPSTFNTTRYHNAEFDAAFERGQKAPSEPQRLEALAMAEKLALADMPLIPLYYPRYIVLLAPNVGGFNINALELLDLRQVHFIAQPSGSVVVDTSS